MNKPNPTQHLSPHGPAPARAILIDLSAEPVRERELIAVLAEMVRLSRAADI